MAPASGRAIMAPIACHPIQIRTTAKANRANAWVTCTNPNPVNSCIPCSAPSVMGLRKRTKTIKLAAHKDQKFGNWSRRARGGLISAMTAIAAKPHCQPQRQARRTKAPSRVLESAWTANSAL